MLQHIKGVAVAKADGWSDVEGWFDSAWRRISGFFKDWFD
jgi:hypothetical protein